MRWRRRPEPGPPAAGQPRAQTLAANSDAPLRVGLVGAGPWATSVHAPMLAASPATALAGVWARRPDAADALATRHGATPFPTFEALLDACDAIAFAVPPAVQAELAPLAAQAGKALLLEKPLAEDLAGAERVAAAIAETRVPSMLLLTLQHAPGMAAFMAAARTDGAFAARAAFVVGGFVGDGAARLSPWRAEHGALLDIGPHAIDLAIQALGPVERLTAEGDAARWISLLLRHHSGGTSEVALSGSVPGTQARIGIEVFGPFGIRSFDAAGGYTPEVFASIATRFAAVARGAPSPADAAYGLELQRLIAEAQCQLI